MGAPLILSPLTKAMLRWAFSLPPEDPDRSYTAGTTDFKFYSDVRKRLGRCIKCGKINDTPQFVQCTACRRYHSQWRYSERPAGAPARCKDCGVIFEGGRRVCDRCAENRRIAKRVRRARGVSHNSA